MRSTGIVTPVGRTPEQAHSTIQPIAEQVSLFTGRLPQEKLTREHYRTTELTHGVQTRLWGLVCVGVRSKIGGGRGGLFTVCTAVSTVCGGTSTG